MSVVGVVLGAGYGTRLQKGLKEDPLSIFNEDVDKTKPLLKVGGYTVADYWVEQFYKSSDIGPIVVVCNDHYKDQFSQWLNELANRNPKMREDIYLISDGSTTNDDRLGAIHAIKIACSHGETICKENEKYSVMSGACIVAGDTLLHFRHIYNNSDPLSFDVSSFIHKWHSHEVSHDALIAYNLDDKNETLKRGILEIDESNRVTSFLEKPEPSETESRLACPPLYALRNSTISLIDIFFKEHEHEHRDKKDSPGTFIQWLINSRKQEGTLVADPFIVSLISGRFDIGNIDQYKHAVAVFGLTSVAMNATAPVVSIGRSYARVGFFGNPSDGYYGKTMSFTIKNFRSEVIIKRNVKNSCVRFFETSQYPSLRKLSQRGHSEGYCGGLRLLKATSAKFFHMCEICEALSTPQKERLENSGFDMYFNTTIPLQVGLAGSSAIVCATFRALSAFYQIPLPLLCKKELWPQQILDVEVKELGIAAGLQDRVTQFYEGVLFMDFDRSFMQENSHGRYQILSTKLLEKIPDMYVAYLQEKPSDSGVVHVSLRQRFNQGEELVLKAMTEFASIAEQAKDILQHSDLSLDNERTKFCDLMDSNFNLRRDILGEDVIGKENLQMVAIARGFNLACKFSGSGGAIICIPRPNALASFETMKRTFAESNISFCKVQAAPSDYPFQFATDK